MGHSKSLKIQRAYQSRNQQRVGMTTRQMMKPDQWKSYVRKLAEDDAAWEEFSQLAREFNASGESVLRIWAARANVPSDRVNAGFMALAVAGRILAKPVQPHFQIDQQSATRH